MNHSIVHSAVCLTVEIVDEFNLDARTDRKIRELLRACFPDWSDIFQQRRIWHNTPPVFTVLGKNDGKIVGHIAVVVRSLTTTWNFQYNVASIQGVCVAPEVRQAGLAHRMLETAVNEARHRGFSYAILFCKEPLVPFYAAQGWKLAEESLVMWRQRDLPISMLSNCPMYFELKDTPFPEGPLDVHPPTW